MGGKFNDLERFFQTKRIQIVVYGERRANYYYKIVIRDVVNAPEIATAFWIPSLTRPASVPQLDGYWSDQPKPADWTQSYAGGYYTNTLERKGDAIAVARREATERSLPFDSKRDILSEDEFKEGPVQDCLHCRRSTGKRAHNVTLCAECLSAIALGKTAMEAGAREYGIEIYESLRPDHGTCDYRTVVRLGEVIAATMGTRIGDAGTAYELKGIVADFFPKRERHYSARFYRIKMSGEQFAGLRELVEIVERLLDAAYASGHAQGESLLLALADNRLTVRDFNERSMAKPRKRDE